MTSILGFGLFGVYALGKKVSPKIVFFIAVFSVLLIINRYYRGERSESYLLYFIPFILILVSWVSVQLLRNKKMIIKVAGIFFVAVILFGNLVGVYETMNYRSQYTGFRKLVNEMYSKFPDSTFSIYDYKYLQYSVSMPISLILSFDGRQSSDGKKIGVSCVGGPCPMQNPPAIISHPFLVVDLSEVPVSEFGLRDRNWINVNQENVYDDLTGWLNQHQLKSTFYLDEYIRSKFIK
jgi:hypothetical protein